MKSTKSSFYDTVRIEGETWYAIGVYSDSRLGRKNAEREAESVRAKGGKARLVVRKTGIQVYSNKKEYLY